MQCDSNVLLPLVNSVVCRVILAHRMSKSGKGAAGRVAASIKTFYVLTSSRHESAEVGWNLKQWKDKKQNGISRLRICTINTNLI